MVFEGEANGRQIIQGLVRSSEVVFNEPLGQVAIKNKGVRRHVAQRNKLVLQRPVESLVDRVVRGSFDSGPVMLKPQILAGCLKVPVEFRSIVSLNILNPAVKQETEPIKEVPGRRRTVARVHPGKGHLGMPVNSGQNEALLSLPVFDNGIQAEEKAREGLAFEFGDLLPSMGQAPFSIDSGLFCGVVVETTGLNDALDFPGRDGYIIRMFPAVEL